MRNFKAEAQSLFDAQTMAELADILGMTGDSAIAAFQVGLIDLCAHYREVISTLPCDLPDAPFNLSLTKRADWLQQVRFDLRLEIVGEYVSIRLLDGDADGFYRR